MRLLIDLQGAQSGSRHRGIGRYSLALAQAMVRERGPHEVSLVLNGLFRDTVEPLRAAFDGLLPQSAIHVWEAPGPVHAMDPGNGWRRQVAELAREHFIASLAPDVLHVSSLVEGFNDDAVHSIARVSDGPPVAVTFYDVIPLIQREVYLTPNPVFERCYREKLDHLARADLFMAISESSRQECIQHLGVHEDQAVNIGAAADPCFRPARPDVAQERALRARFGLDRGIIMYSGATDERKNHLRLIKAYALLPAALRARHQLVIVGGMPGPHRLKFEACLQYCGLNAHDVALTGRVSDDELVALYSLCDLFVFPSWHEGFGLPALEAMSCGAPVIGANATSVPEVIGRTDALFDPFDEQCIADKMASTLCDDTLRADLARHGLAQARRFTWEHSARIALDAMQGLCAQRSAHLPRESRVAALADAIGRLPAPSAQPDWLALARQLTANHPAHSSGRLLVDVSELIQSDQKTGVQRVVRSILNALQVDPPGGMDVLPVYASVDEPGYRVAAHYRAGAAGGRRASDAFVLPVPSDVFLGLDLSFIVMHQAEFFADLKLRGVRTLFVVYDLLPVVMPQHFPAHIPPVYEQWLRFIARADGLMCISQAVQREVAQCLPFVAEPRLRPLQLGSFHLGADVEASAPSNGLPDDAPELLQRLRAERTFLMVGTLEPRKGHLLVLSAFEKLWRDGCAVNLAIVGKQGWGMEFGVELLRTHTLKDRRLFWFEGVSDEYLTQLYAASDCLIAASEGEGFGLPLIEAAQHGLRILARDIPVFREVAGEHAFYFDVQNAEALAATLYRWMALVDSGQAPSTVGMPWLTWRHSAQALCQPVLEGRWPEAWESQPGLRLWGSDDRLDSEVGERRGRQRVSGGRAGYLVYGPYAPVAAGHYSVRVLGSLHAPGAGPLRVDVACSSGREVLASAGFGAAQTPECVATLALALGRDCSDLEVRIWVAEGTRLSVDALEVIPVAEPDPDAPAAALAGLAP